MTEAFICDAARTAIGRLNGGLASVRPDDLGAVPIKALMARNPGLDPAKIDDVIYGGANQSGEDNRDVARMSLLLAGLPTSISGVTVNRLCASGLEAVGQAARAIKTDQADLIIAGGVESMTRAPYVMGKAASAFDRAAKLEDTTLGWRLVNAKMKALYGTDTMPETAENVARDWQVTRDEQDRYAFQTQQRAGRAMESGFFAEEIVPVERVDAKGKPIEAFTVDEHPRPQTTLEDLQKLKPVVRPEGVVTAGNASGLNDGAAAMFIASEAAAKANGLTPRARILGMASAGVDPRVMGIGPVPASRKLMERLGLKISRLRRDRDQRSLRQPSHRLHARARRRPGRRAPERPRRRHRAGPSARHVRRAPGHDRGARPGEHRRQARPRHPLHRRRPGPGRGARAGLTRGSASPQFTRIELSNSTAPGRPSTRSVACCSPVPMTSALGRVCGPSVEA